MTGHMALNLAPFDCWTPHGVESPSPNKPKFLAGNAFRQGK